MNRNDIRVNSVKNEFKPKYNGNKISFVRVKITESDFRVI